MTEMEEKAYRYEMRQRGLELKRRLATLGCKLQEFKAAWRSIGDSLIDYENNRFIVGEGRIRVLRLPPDAPIPPDQHSLDNSIASNSLSYFDLERLTSLLRDLDKTKQELHEAQTFCSKIGDPID